MTDRPDDDVQGHAEDSDDEFAQLIERSSLGTPGARRLRRRVSDEQVRRVREMAARGSRPHPDVPDRVEEPGSSEVDQIRQLTPRVEGGANSMPEAHDDELAAIPVDDPLRRGVGKVVESPVDPQLEILPTNLMDWEDFERLLLDLGRDELGLRSLSYFGKRGQAQMGLDVVGSNAYGKSEGIQSKRVQRFTVSDLDKAVEKFTHSTVPFTLMRLVIGVSARIDDREIAERKLVLNEQHYPLEIDIWDQSRISEMLRDKPQIVIKYFGNQTARRFCDPHVLAPLEVAGPDTVATADAVLLGPLATAGAGQFLAEAKALADDDPAAALTLYRRVQEQLVAAGFPGHAAELNQVVAPLCVRTGEERAAIRLLLDELWAAESAGTWLRGDLVVRALRGLAGFEPFGHTANQTPRTPTLGAAFTIAEFVASHMHAPVPAKIELPYDALTLIDPVDRARSVLFAAERALGDDELGWIVSHRGQIESAAAEMRGTHADLALRLRLALADASGDWSDLVAEARTRMIRELKALTLARHARYLLRQAKFSSADSEWSEAIGEACLAKRHKNAADWLYSQRFAAGHFRGTLDDKWHPLAQALSDLPTRPKIVTTADDARERALAAIHHEELRTAAINLRRQLLDAVRSAAFHDEIDARRLLGKLYRDTENLPLAAYYAVQGGDYKEARAVGAAFGDEYHDVTELTNSPLSWVAASALEFLTEQADLIPDDTVNAVVDLSLEAIKDVASGKRIDSPLYSPQIYLSAYELLAALSERLTEQRAERVLDMLANFVEVKKHHYRRTDGSHIQIAAGIAMTHSGVSQTRALDQLVGLFAREAHRFDNDARTALTSNLEQVKARLKELVNQGHREATALLGYSDPDQISLESAHAAGERLCTPSSNGPNLFGTGVASVNDSLLAATLTMSERVACIDMLLFNAGQPWEPASNRDSYLIAASNLVDGLAEEHRHKFFSAAIESATNPPPSHADAFNASMSNPLGGMRINDRSDSRPAAAFLAARLASSPEEKQLVRDTTLRLIGIGSDDDYRVTTTLQVVRSELGGSIGLLAQGSWTLRSLAAILWAESSEMSDDLGLVFTRDRDVRVRRTLATALAGEEGGRRPGVVNALRADRRWSVRSILRTEGRLDSKERS
jgi:hypothetical protein